MTIGWASIQSAIYTWVTTATGLEAIWAGQRHAPAPTGQYLSLSLRPSGSSGQGWTDVIDTSGAPSENEITHRYRNVYRMELEIQCFAGDGQGAAQPLAQLMKLEAASKLPTRLAALEAGGWVPAEFDAPLDFSGGFGEGAVFEKRAVLTCRGLATLEASETGTYIEFVEATNEISGDTETFPY